LRNNQIEFENLMAFAELIAEENPCALVDFIRLLARPLQSELMIDAAIKGDRRDVPCVDTRNFFWDDQDSYFGALRRTRRRRKDIEVCLGRDLVLPWPWEPGRLVRSLTSIGPGRPWGTWKVDKQNHGLHLWLPWGISFVVGGNHSITAGIISGHGSIAPTEVYDMSSIFRIVHCDGSHYKSADGFTRIAEVTDPRVAAIFETGRLMHRHKVSAW
jgi:hypothetical protein